MPSPFPGMNPYLEHPAFWSSFHTRLMVAIADAIEPQLSSHYYVDVEARTYQSNEGDEELLIEIKERYLEVREMGTDKVIAVIELLLPKNKRAGEGRAAYEKKRRLILGSETHLVELDLLRGAKPMAILGVRSVSPYRILISRSQQRPKAELYGITLQQPLPSFPVPLKPNEVKLIVPLQAVFEQVYERARYDTRIDYHQPVPSPKLSEADQLWVDELLAPIRGA